MARTPSVCLALTSAAAIAGMAAIAAALPAAAQSGDTTGAIFNIFDGSHDGRYPPVTAYAAPSAPAVPSAITHVRPLDLHVRSLSSGGTTCVRLCDGRYFPLSPPAASSRAVAVKVCSAMCPAATTAIFHGGAIDYASGSRGERYADLDNAFVYRQKLVPDCTCNGRDPFGLARIDIDSDPTLRAGDIVATRSGPVIFRGSRGATARAVAAAPAVSGQNPAGVQRALAVLPASPGD
jgi:hypothetical protein